MTAKLILVEGIPGSGKTTFARKIAEWYQHRGLTVNLFTEGQSHPPGRPWLECLYPCCDI